MGLRAREFDKLHPDNKIRIVNMRGIAVLELKLLEEKVLVLYSIYNFFVEAVVDKREGKIVGLERLSLDQVVVNYC